MDLATLGLAVDSSQVERGVVSLDRLSSAAKKAETSAQGAGKGIEKAGSGIGNTSKAAERLGREVAKAEKAMGGLSPASARAADAMAKADRAADDLAKATGRARDANGRYVKSANDNTAATERMTREIVQAERQMGRLERAAGGVGIGIGTAVKAIGAIGAALGGAAALQQSVTSFIQLSDQATQLEGRLRLVTKSSAELASVQQQLFSISQATRSEYGSNVELYVRASTALSALGATQKETLDFTKALNQAFAISGASGAEASSAIIQLSQALGSGALRGDEFNSINEQGPRIMQALAASLGVTRGQLRGLAEDGKLTSEIVFRGILSQASKFEEEFGKIPRTVGAAMTQLRNDLLMAVDSINDSTSATSGLVSQVDELRAIISSPDFASGLTMVVSELLRFASDVARMIADLKQLGDEITAVFQATANAMINTFRGAVDVVSLLVRTGFEHGFSEAGKLAYNVMVEWMARTVGVIADAADKLIVQFGTAIDFVNQKLGSDVPNPFANFGFDGEEAAQSVRNLKATVVPEVVGVADEIEKIWKKAMAGDAFAEATGSMLEAKYGARQVAEELERIAPAAATVAPLAGAIDGGLTKPSEEAAKALRKAEAAKKALFSEADAAVAEFFPMAQAEAEAARLTALINNTSNGLSDLQRNALGMQIAKNFEDAVPAVENLRSSGTRAAEDIGASFIDNVGDVFADVFSQATRDGESFFGSLIKGFAGLGSQLAAAGGKNLIGQLLGIADPASKSAAGIGSIGGGSYGGLPSISSSAGVGMSFASSAPQIQALNRNMGGVGSNVLKLAQSFDGLNERSSSQLLNGFLSKSGTTQLDARTQAWCAAFANAALMENGIQGTGSNLASSFLGFGNATNAPKAGDIVVLKPQGRGSSGHVGFVAGFGDGTVQIFGGNQSNAAKTSSYSTSQVAGYRTYDDERVVAKGVSKGMTDFSRREGPQMSSDAQAAMNAGWDGFSHNGAGGMTGGQKAFGAIGAGVGIFSQGYQSGSPISGGIGGALGGFQAAQALGVAGPVGMVAGAALGILGGILGGRAEREKKHREQAATWADMQPQYLDWQKSVQKARPTSGLSEFFATETSNFDKFRETGGAAWKYGSNNSTQDFIDVGTQMFAKFHQIRDAFRDTIDPMIEALEAGRGMDSPFADARNQLYALGDQLLQFVDDTKESLSYRPDEAYRVDEARAAALAQVDQSLDVVEPLSALAEEIERLQGGALGAKKVMMDLGRSAEEAGRIVGEKLVTALDGVGRNLEQDLRDQIANMDGKGYLADFRSLIEDNAAMMATIAANSALNVDTSLVDEFFRKSAQSLVDGAELTGASFDALIAAFPELSGVVKSFTESVESSAEAIKARSLGYQDRLFAATTDTSKVGGALAAFDRSAAREREEEIKAGGQAILDLEAALAAERLSIIKDFNDRAAEEAKRAAEEAKDFLTNLTRSIKEFTDGLRSGAESPLAPKERLAAAQKQYDDQLALAKTGDRDAANALTGYASDLLEASKAYNASSPDYQATFSAIIAQLEALPKQVSAEQFIVDAITDTAAAQLNATAAMQEALRTAFAAGPGATAAALSSSFSMLDTSLDGLLDYNEMRSALTGIATDAQIRTMMGVLDSNGDGQLSKLELINAATAQQNNLIGSQNSVLNAIVANTQSQHGNAVAAYGLAQNHRDISAEILRTRQLSNARGYMTGGYTGDGPTTQVAGVVHGQEGVLNAGAMRALGRPMLDAMNRGTMRMPAIAMPMMPQMANDNRGMEQRMERVEKAVLAIGDQIARATVAGAQHVRQGVDGVKDAQQDLARDAKLKKSA